MSAQHCRYGCGMPYASTLADSPSITTEYGCIASSADFLTIENVAYSGVGPGLSRFRRPICICEVQALSLIYLFLIEYGRVGEAYPIQTDIIF